MYLFALFLVLYEFTTYSANDMIMPGMIEVVRHFNAPQAYVAQSMTLYILGSCSLQLLVGFFAERFGKRKIILTGSFLFLIFTLLEIYSTSIQQFMTLRFCQGTGMAIIAIGYALIHERFDDKSAIKLAALMANISLLAPLIGPALGAMIMSYFSWEYIFVLSAGLGFSTLIGLFCFTPQDTLRVEKTNLLIVMKQYTSILRDKEFLKGVFCLSISSITLLVWISQSPNLILVNLQQDFFHYAVYQLISMAGLSIASVGMQYIVGRYSLFYIVKVGNFLLLLGVVIAFAGHHYINIIVIGIFIYTFGCGLVGGCVMRLLMSRKGQPKNLLASMTIFLQTLIIVLAMTIANYYLVYFKFSLLSFTACTFAIGIVGYIAIAGYIRTYKQRAWL